MDSDWTSGYVADIGYTHGYYDEFNPHRAVLALVNAGHMPPMGQQTHCELGFGQGVSINMHAAACAGTWYGTDFNPSQTAFAQAMAKASGADVHLYDQSFSDFCSREDLPAFDSIGLHGIWSWVSDANRAIIVDFLRRKLKVGGVLYVSYNTLPGWANFAPVRHLMTQHAEILGTEGKGIVSRVDGALDFVDRLLATQPGFSRYNPQVASRMAKVRDQNRRYLAHEYFNRDWHPMHFATMREWLEPAKVSFAGSAHFLDHIDTINLSADQQAFLKEIPDQGFKEAVRDFIVNQQFRKDYWIKGPQALAAIEQVELAKTQRVILVTARDSRPTTVSGHLGKANLAKHIYEPLFDLLDGLRVVTLGQLCEGMQNHGIAFQQVLQAVMVLVGTGHMLTVQNVDPTPEVISRCARLNRFLASRARANGDIGYLVSPVTGGGVAVRRFEQLFLLAMAEGHQSTSDIVQWTWALLSKQSQRFIKDGKTVESEQDNFNELTEQVNSFFANRLPVLIALRISCAE